MILKIKSLIYYCLIYPIYKLQFGKIGKRARIRKPLRIDGKKNIYISDNVFISDLTWLACLPLTGASKSKLVFQNNCIIGNFNHIYCTNSIVFEKGVLTADKVYISDNLHEYSDVTRPIYKQPIKQLKSMIIGEGAWIGENVCIIGASVGKQSVIGANSVVTKDIPDYCVAVGSPAKVIKKYSFETKTWEKVNN